MTTQVLIYPIFAECKDYTLDPFWQDIFFKCACNRFPRNLRYDNKNHTINIKTPCAGGRSKTEVVDITDDPVEIFQVMMLIFREKLGLRSSRDLQTQVLELEDIKEKNKIDLDCDWKKLKPRTLKDELIMNYVMKLIKEHNLEPKESKILLPIIYLGFQYKKLTADHVDYENGVINNIIGLEFDPEEKKFYITNEPKVISKSEKTVQPRRFWRDVDKFLRDYRSKRLKMM